jgi:hypothetical protein
LQLVGVSIRDISSHVSLILYPCFRAKSIYSSHKQQHLLDTATNVLLLSSWSIMLANIFISACKLYMGAETYICRNKFGIWHMPKYSFGILPKSQIPNPKSQTIAEIPNHCRNPKLLPKSQIAAEIPNWLILARIKWSTKISFFGNLCNSFPHFWWEQNFFGLRNVTWHKFWPIGGLGFRQQFGIWVSTIGYMPKGK